ncbi:MAG: hypothetical protein KJ645_09910 [Planctomycetes bacterium]|nr:hypothetical protein [Planctomycetota bacterium]
MGAYKVTLFLWISMFICSTITAQQINANRLCLNNGGEYYSTIHGIDSGVGKYYPSFAHCPGKGIDSGFHQWHWPWKIRGWAWGGMQSDSYGPTWYWVTTLSYSVDNSYSTTMTWPYPLMYFYGIPHNDFPNNLYKFTYPSFEPWVPDALVNKSIILPSSAGGISSTINLFACGAITWFIPSTTPFYGFNFGFVSPVASAMTLPSGISIYQWVYNSMGPFDQDVSLSGNEIDCMGLGGIKTKSHAIASDNVYVYYWPNYCSGADSEWDMCLFLNDAVSIPVNIPGASNEANPYSVWGYQFDVGGAVLTPNLSSTQLLFQMTYEDCENPGTSRFMLMASPWLNFTPFGTNAHCIPFGPSGNRLPHGWDLLTDVAMEMIPFTISNAPSGLYPACTFGTTIGSLGGVAIPLYYPEFIGLELKFSGISTTGRSPSASILVTYF